MFGHQDDQYAQQDESAIPNQSIDGVMSSDNQASPSGQAWQHPGLPLDTTTHGSNQPDSNLPATTITPTGGPVISPAFTPSAPAFPATTDASDTTNDLIDIKQRALGQLSPLVGHLEQSPEEKFRTTMMMIQASDNQDLIKVAYEAAQQIPDEKIRAQALLDIVNEINYFTQQHQN